MRSSRLFVLEDKPKCRDGTLEESKQKMLLFEDRPGQNCRPVAGRKVKFDDFSSTVVRLTDCNERIRKLSRGENYSVSNAGESNSNNTLALAP